MILTKVILFCRKNGKNSYGCELRVMVEIITLKMCVYASIWVFYQINWQYDTTDNCFCLQMHRNTN